MSQAFCLAVLVAASTTVSAINSIEEDYRYEDSSSYKGAAVWLVIVAIFAIIYNGAVIIVRILYFTSAIENYFSGYAITVSGWLVF